jgi:hypothetical protein
VSEGPLSGWGNQPHNRSDVRSGGLQPSATILSMEVVDPRSERVRRVRRLGLAVGVVVIVGAGAALLLRSAGESDEVASTDLSALPAPEAGPAPSAVAAEAEPLAGSPPEAEAPATQPVTVPPPAFQPPAVEARAAGQIPSAPSPDPGVASGGYQPPPFGPPPTTSPAYQPPIPPPPPTAAPVVDEQAVADCIAAAARERDSLLRAIQSEQYRLFDESAALGNVSPLALARAKELDQLAADVRAEYDASVFACENS